MGPAPATDTTSATKIHKTKVFKGVELNDKNYMIWSFQLKAHLKSMNIWNLVENENTSNAVLNDICFSEIVNNVDENQIMRVIECTTLIVLGKQSNMRTGRKRSRT